MLVYLQQFDVYPRHGVARCGQNDYRSRPGLRGKVASEGMSADGYRACIADERQHHYNVAIHAME
jgi:hypothetical protein